MKLRQMGEILILEDDDHSNPDSITCGSAAQAGIVVHRVRAAIDVLKKTIHAQAERIAVQSELLSKRAEKGGDT